MASLLEPAVSEIEIEYPESDGQPIGETDFHIIAIFSLYQMLRDHFANDPKVYVASNLMFYYEQGNKKAVRAPDVFVVKGVNKHRRRVYKLWEEQVVPCTLFEITSKQTASVDLTTKYQLYERLGISEYFLFDPLSEYLEPRLQGFSLKKGRYQPLPLSPEQELVSQELGLILRPQGDLLRLVDSYTGQMLETSEDSKKRAESEKKRANQAEAKILELQQELERLRRNKD
jgi:Uma2 family endonuclease